MTIASHHAMTIDGRPVTTATLIGVINPATEAVIAHAPDCSAEELDRAIAAARNAFPAWSALPLDKRREFVIGLSQAMIDDVETLKTLLTLEQGKPLADAEGEVMGAAMMLQGYTRLDLPVERPENNEERTVEVHRVPIGVVGAIAPWNFPLILAAFKIGPALLAGNSIVLKPSPFTPLSTLRLGELSRSILPPGVLNVICGGDALGPMLTAHEGVDKISFTGSTPTGKRVMQSAASTLKRVTLELGGNDAAIVMPDVDVGKVAEQIFWSAFANSGQVCIATKRLYIHEDIFDAMVEALIAYAATVAMGDGSQAGHRLGPINNRAQYERVLDLIADARANGYRFLLGGDAPSGPGYFVPVTLIDNPPDHSRIVREEQFGPILPIMRFTDVDEVIARVNDSEYGLGGSVWSADADQAACIAMRLATGNVFVNQQQHLSPTNAFGGHKQSGLGVENGMDGLLEYTNTRTIVRSRSGVG